MIKQNQFFTVQFFKIHNPYFKKNEKINFRLCSFISNAV